MAPPAAMAGEPFCGMVLHSLNRPRVGKEYVK
jgi:hypothetical protein